MMLCSNCELVSFEGHRTLGHWIFLLDFLFNLSLKDFTSIVQSRCCIEGGFCGGNKKILVVFCKLGQSVRRLDTLKLFLLGVCRSEDN